MTAPIALLSSKELQDLMRAAVDAALADFVPAESGEVLLDRAEVSRRLGISTRQLDRLRKEGLPELRVGDVPRWRWDAVLAWLETREGTSKP